MFFILFYVFSSLQFASSASSAIPVGLYEEAGASCLNTSDCYSHSEFVPRNPLLKCIDGYCLCDEDASHFVYQYLSQSYQQKIGCQSLKTSTTCKIGSYQSDRKCSCPPGRIAYLSVGASHGYCHKSTSGEQSFGEYCSALKSGCDAHKLLMCNNYKCTCPRHTHLFIEESNRCIKISNSSKPPKYGEPCSVQIPCADNFICQSNHCRCSAECGPYLKKDGLCACEKNTQVEFLYTKVLPACLAVLVVGSCIIYISYKSGCCSLPKPSSNNASRISNGHSPYSPQANSSHSPYSPQANSTLLSTVSPNTSFPTAPPLPPDEDAPPSYDEVMGSSHHS